MNFRAMGVVVLLVLAGLLFEGCPPSGGNAFSPLDNAAVRMFESRYVYPVAGQAVDMTLADFNHDGAIDAATVNRNQNNVSVLINDGNGGVKPAVNYPAGDAPSAIIAADLTGSGNLDLVTANETYDQVIILPAKGDGTFNQGKTIGLISGSKPRALAVADMSGDGKPDIVTADSLSGTVSVLVSKGSYGYNDPVRLAVGSGPRWILAQDLTGDGVPDMLTVNRDTNDCTLLVGTGGNFVATGLACGMAPRMAIAADFNGDGKQDLLVSNAGSGDFSLLFGQGSGQFAAETRVPLGQLPTRMVAGDFNGDGKLDVAALLYESADAGSLGVVAVLPGDGAGGFGAPLFFGAGAQGYAISAADVDLDNHTDLVVSDVSNSTITVLRGRGDGRFESDQRFPVGKSPRVAAVSDFNKDGKMDMAVGNFEGNNVVIMLGDGNGGFVAQPVPLIIVGKPRAMAAGDLNNDGRADLVVGAVGTTSVAVFLGQGNGMFSPAPAVAVLEQGSIYRADVLSLALADMNADGKLDIVTGNSSADSVSIMLGDGTGKFGAPNVLHNINYPQNVTVADINRDNKLDVVLMGTRDPSSGTDKAEPRVVRIFGKGDGTLDDKSVQRYATGAAPVDMALGDTNGDGVLDAMTAHPADNATYQLPGVADGRFNSGEKVQSEVNPIGVLLPDIDGNGKADILTTHIDGYVVVRRSLGDGKYEAPNHFFTGDAPSASFVADVNGDSVPDLITLNNGTSDISVLLGRHS